ncbi:SOSS complex subunit C [Biomphalaria glabrata]|uniref:SOSS complex subunit C-like n=2 Tax=Biomphalaria TaxID=6525 RepID=A0A2C9L5Q6_BIOGL|nr:SOSS complex subunit C-like [Biomphalaria glabrata]KAI8754107.1 SOSS complex subunit C-like [Biomphalaria glabrata]KAI8773928.1 SOSS complex subunit C [Biomphalaria glabrata]KAK0069771.1 SOSS complex subunit C [Biomphalaria pfeifferi]
MAHSQPPQTQERQNRKLIEHIHEQKKRLQHGHHSSMAVSVGVSPAPILNSPAATVPGLSAAEYASISNPAQRAALQHAHANSVGYFITQDSAFGNLILPVLPRLTDTKTEIK